MKNNAMEIAQKDDIYILNQLTRMLAEQVNIIQCSDVSGKKVEIFAEQIQSVVDEVSCRGLLNMEQFQEQRDHIKRLYDSLNLAVIARSNETEKQLNQIRKGKKTLGTYRNNI